MPRPAASAATTVVAPKKSASAKQNTINQKTTATHRNNNSSVPPAKKTSQTKKSGQASGAAHVCDTDAQEVGTLGSNREKTLEDENAKLRELLERANAARAAAEKKAGRGKATRADETIEERIPRPKGSAGQGFSLRAEMGLKDEPENYNTIVRDVHVLVHKAGLDYTKDYRSQSSEDLGRLFAVARDQHPILERFENDWATSEIVKQYLRNKRKYGYRLGILVPTSKDNASAGENRGIGAKRKKVIGQVNADPDPDDSSGKENPTAGRPRPRPRKRRKVTEQEDSDDEDGTAGDEEAGGSVEVNGGDGSEEGD